ncbi:MAG TPA: DNA (cytosine-5-)-methyltransferase [Pseudogracilibacillus sp.]|nr:DNA (cytosine-5-)-methyltransferase [Pseudogracilibacillus sp.]
MKFIDLFSGIGGFRSALENNGHECLAFAEIDKYARQSYKAIYNTEDEKEYHDITSITDEEWATYKGKCDVICGGSPCFRKGTLINTSEGLKEIENIKKGDLVLTHKKRYKKVVVPMINHSNVIYKLRVMNSLETYVTPEHPIRVVEKIRTYDSKKRKYNNTFTEPKWVETKNLKKGVHYVELGNNKEKENPKNITKEEAWLIGRYIADGYLLDSKRSSRKNSYRKDVIFCVGKHKTKDFESNLDEYQMKKQENKTVFKYKKQNERLFNLMLVCGRGSENKEIPKEYISLPNDLLEEILEGYFSGDGNYRNGVYSFTTVSRKLCLSLVESLNKVYGKGASVTFTKRPEKHVIEGRVVNQRDTYRVQFQKEYKERNPQTLNINGSLYAPIKLLEIQETDEDVYNFEVEDDNSYVANNMVVHNCQSFSIAGKRAGFEDTRGTLFFYYVNAVKQVQPKYFIYENVKGMMSHDGGNTIKTVLQAFDEIGYEIDFDLFNSKYYGVPQNRERIYIVGKKKNEVYKRPLREGQATIFDFI